MSRPLRDQPCVYCGAEPPSERDHIPPANLFATRPSNMITVPSCSSCNRDASQDDEYFRNMLAFRRGFDEHPEVEGIQDAAHNSVLRPEAAGMARAFIESVFVAETRAQIDALGGALAGYHVDLARLDRVVTRVMKGLYFRHLGHRVPMGYGVRTFCGTGLDHIDGDLGDDLVRTVTALRAQPGTTIGENVFSYWFRSLPGEGDAALAFFTFYEREWFLSLVAEEAALPPVPVDPDGGDVDGAHDARGSSG